MKTQEDYIKEIAEKFNKGKRVEVENPTKDDILNLGDYDVLITEGKCFPVLVRKRYMLDTVLNIPTVMFFDDYQIGDMVMGFIDEGFSIDEILEEIKGFKGF